MEDIAQENAPFLSFLTHEYKYAKNTTMSLFEGLHNHEGYELCCAFAANIIQEDIDYISLNPIIIAVRKQSEKVS